MRLPLLLLTLATCARAATAPPLDLGGVREEHVMVPMRDGQRLSAYLYFPPGDGKWPAVFEQRYAAVNSTGSRKAAAGFASAGFVVALVNFRGTHESEGAWRGYRGLQWGELRDGYDMCEWLAAQPWCTGKVGTYGGSQAGYAQNYLAVTQPPHLVAQYMTDTGLSLFHEGYRLGGVTRPLRARNMGQVARDPADIEALLREWDRHPDYDDYWRAEDCTSHFGEMNVPCFTIGSWFDFMNQGSIASFRGRQSQGGPASRGHQHLVLGPWLHGGYPKSNKIGELTFPEIAGFDVYASMKLWFAHFLGDEANSAENVPTVRYYVMGAAGEPGAPGNLWREAEDFPPPAERVSLFLQPEGALATTAPKEASAHTSYLSDPRAPMSIPGTSFPGARDARPFEQQSEVRTWTTAPLIEPQEWTGEVQAEIFASSTARDTDFLLRVSDVYPDGRSILLMDYPLRARYREGFEKQVLLTPGEPAKLAWHIGWTSIIFNRGHRIRVTLASTGAPLYEPNNQTGGPQTFDWLQTVQAATNTIWHDQAHPSQITVPLVSQPR